MSGALPQIEDADGVSTVTVAFGDLPVERAAIVSALGYGEEEIPEHFGELLGHALREATARCRPRAGYRLVAVSRCEGRGDALTLGGRIFTTQRIVAGALARAEQAAVFAATIGPDFETWARAAMADDPALGYIADVVGSAVAEALADRLHDHIGAAMAARGWKATNRYSPGYCGWSVAEQHGLFALLPDGFCGIALSESALMHPVKSVSGIIGAGPAVRYSDYLCDACGRRDCTYR